MVSGQRRKCLFFQKLNKHYKVFYQFKLWLVHRSIFYKCSQVSKNAYNTCASHCCVTGSHLMQLPTGCSCVPPPWITSHPGLFTHHNFAVSTGCTFTCLEVMISGSLRVQMQLHWRDFCTALPPLHPSPFHSGVAVSSDDVLA